jgi:hypothetical protein
MCGRLNNSMYGTRDAAQNWEYEYSGFLEGIGFTRGRCTPCVFHHVEKNMRMVVHGDDFTVLANAEELDWFRNKISEKFEVKFRGRMGPGPEDLKNIRILNRVVSWDASGIKYEADTRHAEIIVREMGLGKDTKGVVTPGVKATSDELAGFEEPIEQENQTKYRALAARAMYLSQDRGDIGYAAKEISRGMSTPTAGDMGNLKRLARYLVDKERVVIEYDYQEENRIVEVWTDSDYAGCTRTRKSTTGGVCRLGGHLIKTGQ